MVSTLAQYLFVAVTKSHGCHLYRPFALDCETLYDVWFPVKPPRHRVSQDGAMAGLQDSVLNSFLREAPNVVFQ
jgi:hypothetical protein